MTLGHFLFFIERVEKKGKKICVGDEINQRYQRHSTGYDAIKLSCYR